jgi:predicted nucleic acid-binding protein
MMLLLDTSYLLPAIGISVKGLPRDALLRLIKKGYTVSISDISIFELSAKAAKYISQGTIPAERVTKGIRAIVYEEALEKIPIYETPLLHIAFKLRGVLKDFIDCLILSAALSHCDTLVTEDIHIHNIKQSKEYISLLTTHNPNFTIKTLDEML